MNVCMHQEGEATKMAPMIHPADGSLSVLNAPALTKAATLAVRRERM
jgi:hypothetical protein